MEPKSRLRRRAIDLIDLGPLPRPAAWPPIGRTMDRTADDLTTASGGTKIPIFLPKIPLRTVLLYYKGL